MNDSLAIYLHDHWAGSNSAIEHLTMLRADHEGEASRVAASVLPEIEKDRKTFQSIIERVGRASFDLKEAAAWVAEKASRLNLRSGDPLWPWNLRGNRNASAGDPGETLAVESLAGGD